jgi:hypothetical protein
MADSYTKTLKLDVKIPNTWFNIRNYTAVKV